MTADFVDKLLVRAFKCDGNLKIIDVENNKSDIILQGKKTERKPFLSQNLRECFLVDNTCNMAKDRL